MNDIVKEQLSKCKIAQVPSFDDNTTLIVVHKREPEKEPELNHYYIIELEDYIINEPAGFTLSANWNKGVKPSCSYYKAEVIQIMGKMIKVRGIGYNPVEDSDYSEPWTGWLPRSGFHIKKELS